jgi:RNA polymerase sigma-70 factor (ECF subfamily)
LRPDEALDRIFREEHGLVLASLVRFFRDIDLAEESLQDAVTTALRSWTVDGIPDHPAGWLLTVARRKGIDQLRRRKNLARVTAQLPEPGTLESVEPDEEQTVPDERLRLMFTCCHPALPVEARVALTLRTLGGLTTAEIARAFLTTEATMYQRITRAKRKIALAGIPYTVPAAPEQLAERLEAVLAVIYLIFNEGYSGSSGTELVRVDLCQEAIRLAEIAAGLLPSEPEPAGLAALLCLIESRRPARLDPAGDLVLLEDQDRSRWDGLLIERGLAWLQRATAGEGGQGAYVLQARVAAVHAAAQDFADTDWPTIILLYESLARIRPTPVVALNHAAAMAMWHGAEQGLELLGPLAQSLDGYQPFHAARGELAARAGRWDEAVESLQRAIGLSSNEVELRHLLRRLELAHGKLSTANPPTP